MCIRDRVIDTNLILERSGESFKRFIFSFNDQLGNELCLRPDLTIASCVRYLNQNIRSEVYLGDSGLKSQLKYADKRSSPAVILCGDDEFKNNKITLKKLNPSLKETSKNLSREEWKKSEDTQITFDKENLIDEIKKLF